MVSVVTWSTLPFMIHSNPSRTPSTPRMVAAPITLLIPGAGPPPTRMASFFWWLTGVPSSPQYISARIRAQRLSLQERDEVAREALRLLPVRRVPGAGVDDEPRALDRGEKRVLVGPGHHRVLVAPHEEGGHLDLLEAHGLPGGREARGDLVPDAGGSLLHLADHRLEERSGEGPHGGADL